MDLQREGFDIEKIQDKLYFLENGKYVPMDHELHEKILKEQVRM